MSLTRQAVDHRRPLFFLFLLWCGAVLSVHLTDRGGAFSLDLCVKFLIKQNLVHQVRLHGAGLCRGFRGPIVVAWKEEKQQNHYYISNLDPYTQLTRNLLLILVLNPCSNPATAPRGSEDRETVGQPGLEDLYSLVRTFGPHEYRNTRMHTHIVTNVKYSWKELQVSSWLCRTPQNRKRQPSSSAAAKPLF